MKPAQQNPGATQRCYRQSSSLALHLQWGGNEVSHQMATKYIGGGGGKPYIAIEVTLLNMGPYSATMNGWLYCGSNRMEVNPESSPEKINYIFDELKICQKRIIQSRGHRMSVTATRHINVQETSFEFQQINKEQYGRILCFFFTVVFHIWIIFGWTIPLRSYSAVKPTLGLTAVYFWIKQRSYSWSLKLHLWLLFSPHTVLALRGRIMTSCLDHDTTRENVLYLNVKPLIHYVKSEKTQYGYFPVQWYVYICSQPVTSW